MVTQTEMTAEDHTYIHCGVQSTQRSIEGTLSIYMGIWQKTETTPFEKIKYYRIYFDKWSI